MLNANQLNRSLNLGMSTQSVAQSMSADKALLASRLDAAKKLHAYMEDKHWSGEALLGPDPGIRLNYRIGRFVKSYLPQVSWKDDYAYMQAHAYWVLSNWSLFSSSKDEKYKDLAEKASDFILNCQLNDGAFEYPNPEWKGRIATAEGTWASLGLLESYRQTGRERYLHGALKWHDFLVNQIGFQKMDDGWAINYFVKEGNGKTRVPNNSSTVLRFLGELQDIMKEDVYGEPCEGLIQFLTNIQKPTGEYPYTVHGEAGQGEGRYTPHFQCYQYNSFQLISFVHYYAISKDIRVLRIIENLLRFLPEGVSEEGYTRYQCGNQHREVVYHTAATAAAFHKVGQLGMSGVQELSNKTYRYLINKQKEDGYFPYSFKDYRYFTDQRSYPRYLAMILLLLQADTEVNELAVKHPIELKEA